jgi:hypothetical protein
MLMAQSVYSGQNDERSARVITEFFLLMQGTLLNYRKR